MAPPFYTHRGFGGEYKIHAQLLLSLTKLSNVDDRRNCSFQIHHPRKSFIVVAESPEMKRVWMRDINEAKAVARKGVVERQLSIMSRLRLESDRVMSVLQDGQSSSTALQTGRAAAPLQRQASSPLKATISLSSTANQNNKKETRSQQDEGGHDGDDGEDGETLPKVSSLSSNPSELSPLIASTGDRPRSQSSKHHATTDGGGVTAGLGGKSFSKGYSHSSSSFSDDRQSGSGPSATTAGGEEGGGGGSSSDAPLSPLRQEQQPLPSSAYNTPARQMLQRSNTDGSSSSLAESSFVELEYNFADGLGVLQKILRGGNGRSSSSTRTTPASAPSSTSSGGSSQLDDQARAELIGYFLQYREGDCPLPPRHGLATSTSSAGGEISMDKRLRGLPKEGIEAWRANGGMSETSAMTKFLLLLDTQWPGWREEAAVATGVLAPSSPTKNVGGGGGGRGM